MPPMCDTLTRTMRAFLLSGTACWEHLHRKNAAEKPVYGITKNIHTYNLGTIATHEFANLWQDLKRAPSLGHKLKYIFYPPGWSHDGPDMRARTLRKNQLSK